MTAGLPDPTHKAGLSRRICAAPVLLAGGIEQGDPRRDCRFQNRSNYHVEMYGHFYLASYRQAAGIIGIC